MHPTTTPRIHHPPIEDLRRPNHDRIALHVGGNRIEAEGGRRPMLHLTAYSLIFSAILTLPVIAESPHELQTLAPLLPGTTLPVELQHSLSAGHTAVGARVLAKTTQRVPVGPDLYLKRGAMLTGEVVASAPGTLSIRFTSVRYRRQTVPLAADTLAVANFTDVSDTAAPANGSTDRGNPSPASWTTRQVGGDEVFRSGWSGPVCNTTMQEVGFADFNGVYQLPPQPPTPGTPQFPLAVGVFSTSAAGLYGFEPELSLHSSKGVLTLNGPPGKASLHGGDNLLLKVVTVP